MKTLVVVGTGGGVGATTLVALTFARLRGAPIGAPWLLGPVDGDLALRADGGMAPGVNRDRALWDAGVLRPDAALARLNAPDVWLAFVAPATPLGAADVSTALDRVATEDPRLLERTTVVFSGAFGGRRLPAAWSSARHTHLVPFDARLAVPGPVAPFEDLHPGTRRALDGWVTWVGAALGTM